jgi:hypothetical protein
MTHSGSRSGTPSEYGQTDAPFGKVKWWLPLDAALPSRANRRSAG